QSPAKRLLGMRVIRDDGAAADLGWMLIRDLAVRGVAFGAVYGVLVAVVGEGVGGAINSLVFTLAALWCVYDANRQCLWDKIVRTRVVNDRA
ncbi:MAG: RDD family protein, partial [Chloroflexota bacterium]|nr:RDD family protein [Chloroflexota bacterium]